MTTTTLTSQQIRTLRDEAIAAGDEHPVCACNVALSSDEHGDGENSHAAFGFSTRAEAIAYVEDIVASARAMID